jgi:hypothetical protein
MSNDEHATVFFGKPVTSFESSSDWSGPEPAYCVSITWDDRPKVLLDRLKELLAQPNIDKLEALLIGAWQFADGSISSEAVVKALVKNRQRLSALKAIFLGDIISEENEMSWIQQSDVSPLLEAFPQLQLLRVRGGNGLKFSQTRHDALRQLIVETTGLGRSVLREICRCEFAALEHLELWLGEENHGWDAEVADLQPILSGKLFPKLSYLGLRNSDVIDEIAAVVVNAPILQQLAVLDLSNGTLTDVGAQALLNLPAGLPLKELNLSHHFMTPGMVKRLKKQRSYKVVAADAGDPDDEYLRLVLVNE